MGKDKEPLDTFDGPSSTGIHFVALATIAAPGSTREELDLAALILRRNPSRAAPRESESCVEAFNRLLDVAIDSANNSAGCGTRAERRSRLAADLGREDVVLLDCKILADLVGAKLELTRQLSIDYSAKQTLVITAVASSTCSSTAATAFATVPASAIAGVTSADDLGSELYSSELANDGTIDVSLVND